MVYALIKNGIIENTIVADSNFISTIQSQWDACVRIDELETQPGIGWEYDGEVFTNPNGSLPIVEEEVPEEETPIEEPPPEEQP